MHPLHETPHRRIPLAQALALLVALAASAAGAQDRRFGSETTRGAAKEGDLFRKVERQIEELCKRVSCDGLERLPAIEAAIGFARPGGVLAIVGGPFGPDRGGATLHLAHWDGSPRTADPEILEWTPTVVGVILPPSLEGFMAQTARIALRRADGKEASFDLPLKPKLAWQSLPRSAVGVHTCDDDGDANRCNDTVKGTAGNYGAWAYRDMGGAIEGFHGHAQSGLPGTDRGTDVYDVTLKRGWRLTKATTQRWVRFRGDRAEGPSPAAPPSGATWRPSYPWSVSGENGTVHYSTYITIEGPRGVPFE